MWWTRQSPNQPEVNWMLLGAISKRIGQPNSCTSNKEKPVWVTGCLEPKHHSNILWQNGLKQLRDGPLLWEKLVAAVLALFENWLPLEYFENAEWIWWQWVELYLNKCASDIWDGRNHWRQGKKQPLTDLGEHTGKKARCNLPELPTITFMIVICWVSNGNHTVLSPKQPEARYTDIRHWEWLLDFGEKNWDPNKPYIPTSIVRCTFEQNELDETYMTLYIHLQMINNPRYGRISFHCCVPNAFKL